MSTKPLLIYDGGCRFCCRSVEALKAVTGDRVDYEPSQAAAARFPRIPAAEFDRAVQWVGPDGRTCGGAEAVLSAIATSAWYGRLALWLYRCAPGFSRLAEALYSAVAARRGGRCAAGSADP